MPDPSFTRPLRRPGLALGVPALAAAATLALVSAAHAAPGDLRTVAGGYGGGQALGLGLVPNGVAVDGGTLVVADGQNGMLRRVELASGESTVLAGTGAPGTATANTTSGLTGLLTPLPGLGASVSGPQAVALAPNGDIVFAVGSGGTVRRWSAATGIVTRVAGTGAFSSAAPGDGGQALAAQFGVVQGLVVDADGAILVADTSANRVRRIGPDGTVSTIAGGGAVLGDGGPATGARIVSPRGLALNADGDLLIAETGGNRVRRIAAVDGRVTGAGVISTVVGDGIAAAADTLGDGNAPTAARVNGPSAVAVLSTGALVVAEGTGRRLRFVTVGADPRISSIAVGSVDTPTALAARGNRVYVTETGTGSRRVLEIALDTATGALLSGTAPRPVAGNGSLGFSGQRTPAAEAQLSAPRSVSVAADGAVYVADTGNSRLRRIDPEAGRITTTVGSGASCAAAADATCVGDVPALEAKLARPWDSAVAADGTAYLLESNALISRVSRRDPASGRVTPLAGGAVGFAGDGASDASAVRFNEAQGLALSADDRVLYVADTNNHRVRRIDLDTGLTRTIAGTGTATTTGDGGLATAATVRAPIDIAVNPDGDVVFSTDLRVRRIDARTGTITTVAGGGAAEGTAAQRAAFDSARGIAVAPDGGIAVADQTAGVVWRVAPDGSAVERVAGVEDQTGFDGDAGRADETRLSGPYAVAYRPSGALLIADTGNNRIREVEGPAAPAAPGSGDPAPVVVPGPERLVPGPERLVPGPERLVPGPERLVPGPERLVPGPVRPVAAPALARPTVGSRSRTVRRLNAGLRVGTTVRGADRVRVELVVPGATSRRLGLSRTSAALVLGSRTVRVGRDGEVVVRVRPDARARRILLRAPRASSFVLRVRVTASRPGAPSRTVTTTLRVRGR